MIDVSELMRDPDFAVEYKITRQSGKWVGGRFKPCKPETLTFYGPVQPAGAKELEQLPEGDRQKGAMVFYCSPPDRFYLTRGGEDAGFSDIAEWDGERYKLTQIMPWSGWMSAVGVRLEDRDGKDA